MTKRILALMLAVLLAVSCFALTACGGEEEKKEQGNTNTETPGNTEDPKDTTTPEDTTTVGDTTVVDPGEVEIPEVTLFEESAKVDTGKTYNLADMFFTLADEYKFASSDETVATIDADGLITGVKEGTATITIYVVVNGKDYEGATFAVTVTAPWAPTDPISQEAVKAKNELTKYETFSWFDVNVSGLPQYNVRGQEGTTAGPVEIWSNTLQFLFRFQQSEVNATIGADDMTTYNFFFDIYYRPYDETNDRGDYKKATIQPWSIYTDQNAIYRCKFYDAFFVNNDGLVEGQLYDIIMVVREGNTQLGYAEAEFTWTDSCAIFVEAAEADPTIIK